jgi:hypothetical protein
MFFCKRRLRLDKRARPCGSRTIGFLRVRSLKRYAAQAFPDCFS